MTALDDRARQALVRRGFALEWATLGWNVAGIIVLAFATITARSVALPEDWNPDWTTALIDLLTVLMRLTELEPAQADLLDCILSGRLPSASDLQSSGTRWPQTPRDRAPRYSVTSLGASSPAKGSSRSA